LGEADPEWWLDASGGQPRFLRNVADFTAELTDLRLRGDPWRSLEANGAFLRFP
jgi:hypothetical protein